MVTKEYIKRFIENTGKGDLGNIIAKGKNNGPIFSDGATHLSACAGVAFIKSSYPFYFGYQLAEELCSAAKKVAKDGLAKDQSVKSCIMFHKVQDSFIMSYSDIVKRELSPKSGQSLQFGPYYIDAEDNKAPEGYITIDELEKYSSDLSKEENEGVRTGIRQWLTLLHDGNGRAKQHLERLKEINRGNKLIDSLTTKRLADNAVPAEDCLALYTINNQVTNSDKG